MKTFARFCIIALAALCGVSQAQREPAVELAGARWLNDPAAARQLAAAQNKPLLVFEMLGRLDEQWC